MILFPLRRIGGAPFLAIAGVLTAVFTSPCSAQERERRVERDVRIVRTPDGVSITRGGAPDRAVLGLMLGEGSRADTAGVRVEGVEPNGPAAKAGLKAGDIITDINGTSLRVAREDADDPALTGLAQRRLQRAIAKAKPGDEVKLQVRSSGGSARSVTVKTIAAAELDKLADAAAEMRDGKIEKEERIITRYGDGNVMVRRSSTRDRAMVGVSVGSAGNARDTLGLFVSSVVSGGPAEKAGVIEGERIAAINGVDVRVPREDVDDAQVASARTDRFVREVQKVEPGKSLSLRVYGNGRYRDVTVTAGKASDMPGDMPEGPMHLEGLMPGMRLESLPEGEVRIRRNGGEPRVFEFRRDGPRGQIRIDGNEIEIEGLERAMEEMGRRLQDRMREVEIDVRGLPMLPGREMRTRVRRTVV